MEIKHYANQKKKIYDSLIEIVESETDCNELCQNLYDEIQKQNIENDSEELKEFLEIISKICNNHNRSKDFHKKIEQILLHYSKQIKQNITNYEIFNYFKKDKFILLSLFEHEIINLDEDIINFFFNKNQNKKYQQFHFDEYFFPEIKNFLNEEQQKLISEKISKKITNFDEFYKKRKIGENDSKICEMIRQDSVKSFIVHVNRNNYSLNSKINPSIFETNYFLIKNESTLIEYAVFFGSIQIFQYLRLNNVKEYPSLWLYAIHGKNPDIIHLLEDDKVQLPNKNTLFLPALKESIKCHHNDFTNYIIDNFISAKDNIYQIDENFHDNIYAYCFHYHNYDFLTDYLNKKNIHFYLCKYGYIKLVKLFIKHKNIDFNIKIIQFRLDL